MSKVPTPPSHLSKRMKQYWRDIAGEFLLEPHQLEILRKACEASDRADEARALLDKAGLTVTDRYDQVKPHPAVNIERDARLAFARLTRELALSPAEPEETYSRPPRPGTAATGKGNR